MSDYSIGAKLTELRTAKGLTQEELASKLNVSNKTVSKWENGQSAPDLEMLCGIARYFEVSTDSILGLGISDTVTAEAAISRELADLSRSEAIVRTFEITKSLVPTVFGHMKTDDVKSPVPNNKCEYPRSAIELPDFYELCVNSEDVNACVMMLKNKSNFAWLKDDEKMRKVADIFALLSDTDALKLIALLNSESFSENFTAEYASEKSGIPVEKVKSLLAKFEEKTQLCTAFITHMIDGERTVYASYGDSFSLALVSLVYDNQCGKNAYLHCYGKSGKMIKGDEK